MLYGRLFWSLRLQILGEAFPIKYRQLVQYPVPVSVTLCPFFHYISTCKIKHLFIFMPAVKEQIRQVIEDNSRKNEKAPISNIIADKSFSIFQ